MTDKQLPSSTAPVPANPSLMRTAWHRVKRAAIWLWCAFVIALVVVGDTVMRIVL